MAKVLLRGHGRMRQSTRPVTGGTVISNLKSLVSIIRTRRTVVFHMGSCLLSLFS
jgi:hypothetical protein